MTACRAERAPSGRPGRRCSGWSAYSRPDPGERTRLSAWTDESDPCGGRVRSETISSIRTAHWFSTARQYTFRLYSAHEPRRTHNLRRPDHRSAFAPRVSQRSLGAVHERQDSGDCWRNADHPEDDPGSRTAFAFFRVAHGSERGYLLAPTAPASIPQIPSDGDVLRASTPRSRSIRNKLLVDLISSRSSILGFGPAMSWPNLK